MKSGYLIKLAAMATLPLAVSAQAARTGPADPASPVRAPQYESAFRDYQRWREPQESPAKTWRATNDEVGKGAPGMAAMGDGMPAMHTDMPASGADRMPHQHEGK
jgi:hypothetical protein